jgi:peptidoglycan-associated lipoprotein
MRTTIVFSMAILAGSLSIAACAHNKPVEANDVQTTSHVAPTSAVMQRTDQVVNVEQDVRKLCDIDDKNRAPKFDFDSTLLSSNDRDVLQQVATCMSTGPLKGKAVALIGRADPRGEAEYNMDLGESRANAAKAYLRQLGIDGSRLSDTSRGALDATGHDEESWRIDRRVDISLAR